MLVSLLVCGVIVYFLMKFGINELSASLKDAGEFFGMQIAHWFMLAIAVIVSIVCVPIYCGANKLLGMWDGENEDISDVIDRKLSFVIWITSAALIISYFLIAASYSAGFTVSEKKEFAFSFFISIAVFLIIMIEAIIIQQKCVDIAKNTNPEKNASVYDMKFQKKWLGTCDEAEKIMIGKCDFKVYSATNKVCTFLAIVLALFALTFGIGFFPFFAVCLIWIVNQSVYYKEAIKYSKAWYKLS